MKSTTSTVNGNGTKGIWSILHDQGWPDFSIVLTHYDSVYTDIALTANAKRAIRLRVRICTGWEWPFYDGNVTNDPGYEWMIIEYGNRDRCMLSHYVIPKDHAVAGLYLASIESQRGGLPPSFISFADVCHTTFARYRDRWDLLRYAVRQIPIMLPASLHEVALRDGFKNLETHPWRRKMPEW